MRKMTRLEDLINYQFSANKGKKPILFYNQYYLQSLPDNKCKAYYTDNAKHNVHVGVLL
jgi:hypothetical protein